MDCLLGEHHHAAAEYGYVGVILITAFTYALIRLRFIFVVTVTLFGIAAYLPYVFSARYVVEVTQVLATLYLVSFGFLGAFAAYWMERFARELFMRERELDQERTRSDALLLNILPAAVIERLKTSSGERIAQAFESVTVVFIDAVGSTEQAARTTPELFAESLDELFRSLDVIASKTGSRRSRRSATRIWPSRARPCPWTTMPRPQSPWRRRSALRKLNCGGPAAIRSRSVAASRADRWLRA